VDDRQAPHLAVTLFCRGILQRLVSRIYFPDEAEANATDPVLLAAGARATTLVAVPDGPRGLRHDLVLQGERETVFFVF
jgi:protocatechuate 3,4-dioxygenase alpha subunit